MERSTSENGRFTETELADIRAWLAEKVPGALACSSCKSPKSNVAVFKAHISAADFTMQYPAAVLLCVDCGRMELFNTMVMGVEKPDPRLPAREGADG